jgi:NADH:ubiquinone oxidoreductase subunit 6 (subunit J)
MVKNTLPLTTSVNYPVLAFEVTNTEMLGWLVYTYTFFIFLVVSLILLIAMIGSIVLVLNQNVNIKRQLIFRQTLKSLKSSVSLKN